VIKLNFNAAGDTIHTSESRSSFYHKDKLLYSAKDQNKIKFSVSTTKTDNISTGINGWIQFSQQQKFPMKRHMYSCVFFILQLTRNLVINQLQHYVTSLTSCDQMSLNVMKIKW